MGEIRKLLKKYIPVFLSLMLLLSPVLSSVSEAAYSSKSTTSTLSAKSGDYVYYSVYNKIYRVNTKNKQKKLIHYKKNWWSFDNIVVYKGYIYTVVDTCSGTGETYPYIYRVKTDGTNGKILDKGDNLKLYDGKLYYNKYNFKESNFYGTLKKYGIYRMNLDGSSKKSIKSGSNIYDFEIYKSNIYYQTSKNIYRISTSGKNNIRLLSSEGKEIISIYGATLEGNYIIYTSPGTSMNKNTRLSIIRNNGKENTTLAEFFVS